MAQTFYVLNTVLHRPLRQLPNIPISLVDSVKFLPFLILWCFESLWLPLFIGSWMLGATARKKCFGNHCRPRHSVSLTCSSGWQTRTFSHTHCYCIFQKSFSHWTQTRPYNECPVTMNVQNFHHSRNQSLALAGIPKLFCDQLPPKCYFTGPNSRLLGTEVPTEITETLVSAMHWMGFHCHAAGSHLFTDH